jgi:hypothetical protein
LELVKYRGWDDEDIRKFKVDNDLLWATNSKLLSVIEQKEKEDELKVLKEFEGEEETRNKLKGNFQDLSFHEGHAIRHCQPEVIKPPKMKENNLTNTVMDLYEDDPDLRVIRDKDNNLCISRKKG